jgi:hypothetical protein
VALKVSKQNVSKEKDTQRVEFDVGHFNEGLDESEWLAVGRSLMEKQSYTDVDSDWGERVRKALVTQVGMFAGRGFGSRGINIRTLRRFLLFYVPEQKRNRGPFAVDSAPVIGAHFPNEKTRLDDNGLNRGFFPHWHVEMDAGVQIALLLIFRVTILIEGRFPGVDTLEQRKIDQGKLLLCNAKGEALSSEEQTR